jgi:hypothetical protein
MDSVDYPPWQTQTLNFINHDPTPTEKPPAISTTPSGKQGIPAHPGGGRPGGNSTAPPIYTVNHEKWRVPTVLAATVAVALGAALAAFLAWVAWRRVRKRRRRLLVVRAQLQENERQLQMIQQQHQHQHVEMRGPAQNR